METRRIASTDLELSAVGFGVWTIASGWWGEYTHEQCIEMLQAAFESGITFFNTGNTYGDDGYAETLVRDALGHVRDQIVIGTTFGYDVASKRPNTHGGQSERKQDWSPDHVRRSLESSLTNLGVDSIDLWQLHNPRMDALTDDTLWECLYDLQAQGLVKAIGPSMGPAIGWRDEGVFALNERKLDFFHHIYNLLEQDPGREFTELAAEKEVAVLVRVPHSSGLLEDRYTLETTFDAKDHRSHRTREWLVEGLQKIDQLRFLLEDREGATMGQLAIKWLLSDPAVTSVQPNIYDMAGIKEFAAATDIEPLDADELGEIEALYRANFGVGMELQPTS